MTSFTWGPDLNSRLKSLALRLVDFLLPRYCFSCQRLLGQEEFLFCRACSQMLPRNQKACLRCGLPLEVETTPCLKCLEVKTPITRTFAPFLYQGPIKEAICNLKYEKKIQLVHDMATFVKACLPGKLFDEELVVCPVPLHPRRLWQRGFNQSQILAEKIFPKRRVKLLLNRTRYTKPQTGLSGRERHANVRGAFALAESVPKGKKILLFDDVLTTGATAKECARTLLAAGASEIWLVVVARAS